VDVAVDKEDVRLLMADLAISCRDAIHTIDHVYVDVERYRNTPASKKECLDALRTAAKDVAAASRRVLEKTAEEP
jgi:hypothetical protein